MRSNRLAKLENLPVLARARHRRTRVRKPSAAPRVAVPPQLPEARTPTRITVSARFFHRVRFPGAHVPYLRLSGRWLEERGFTIGATIAVHIEEGRLVLTNPERLAGTAGDVAVSLQVR